MWTQFTSAEEKEDHLPQPDGNALPHAAQDTVGHPGHTAGPWTTPWPPGPSLLPSRSAPSLYWCMGLFLHRGRTLHLPLLLQRFLLPISPACLKDSTARWGSVGVGRPMFESTFPSLEQATRPSPSAVVSTLVLLYHELSKMHSHEGASPCCSDLLPGSEKPL